MVTPTNTEIMQAILDLHKYFDARLSAFQADVDARLSAFQADVDARFSALQADVDGKLSAMRTESADFRVEVRTELRVINTRLDGIDKRLDEQGRYVAALIPTKIAAVGNR